jgi:hypothetical protein
LKLSAERGFRERYTQQAPDRTVGMADDEYPREPPEDVPPEHHDRARELQLELLVLEARLESANFEDKEAFRRAIRERREELDGLRTGSG